ncbi:MAG TPA: hypothetical protein VE338_17490 [Ktedonobacterales bacterium]|jgi:hypothetical protein|nr:hypothetical protein [Ktedonobacterales bacterium]
MWQSSTPAAVAILHMQHLFVGGLGGIIAVVVGGVVSVITLRANKRAAQPAPAPQRAPASRRTPSAPAYAEPAPPTSPARRLHPGPISLSAPGGPQPDDGEQRVTSSLFDPDILSAAPSAQEDDTLAELGRSAPILRSASHISAEWRAQAAPLSPPEVTHAPIWNRSPFARPRASTSLSLDGLSSSPFTLTSAPPIWRSTGASALFGPSAQPDTVAGAHTGAEMTALFATPAPIWTSRLRPRGEEPVAERDARLSNTENQASVDSEAPIWPSYLLRPE